MLMSGDDARSRSRRGRSCRRCLVWTLVLPALLPLARPLAAQGTRADYERAERFLGVNARSLVAGDAVAPTWLDNDRFWYRNRTKTGTEFVVIDPVTRTRKPAFDHVRLAAALSLAADTSYIAEKLPFTTFEYTDGGKGLRVALDTTRGYLCDLTAYTCRSDKPDRRRISEAKSPDGKWVAFERDENLYVRNVASGQETQLSKDGEKDFGYAVNPQACCDAVTSVRLHTQKRPILAWSADSKKIGTYKLDERNVKDLYLLETHVGRPILHPYKYALPGDSVVPRYEVDVFDVLSQKQTRSPRGFQDAVNTSCCWFTSDTLWKDAQWGSGSDDFYYTHGQRDFKKFDLVHLDLRTGQANTILSETSPTFVEFNLESGGFPNWRVINGNREVIWFSERDGWGHLYLFDAQTGKLKNRITEGPWVVLDVLKVDEATRQVWFTAGGREPGRDPYFRNLYRVGLDGTGLTLLTPEDADHQINASPSGHYFIDSLFPA